MSEKSAEGLAAAENLIRIGLRARDPMLLALIYSDVLSMEVLAARFPDELVADPVADILAAKQPIVDPQRAGSPQEAPDPYEREEDPFAPHRRQPGITIHPDPRRNWAPQTPPAPTPPLVVPNLRFNPSSTRPTGADRRQAQADFARWVESGDPYTPGIAGDID